MYYSRLKQLREESNLSVEELCESANIDVNDYKRQEAEENQIFSFDLFIAIADYYDVSIDYILKRTDKRKWQ